MFVRAAEKVAAPLEAVTDALKGLDGDELAELAQAASRDGYHLHAHLSSSVRGDDGTTFHLRWWNDRDRSLTPALHGELEFRPLGRGSTEVTLTAQYWCRTQWRELADPAFLRRVAQSVAKAFLNGLVDRLESATGALAPAAW
jgi:hypothetical protein